MNRILEVHRPDAVIRAVDAGGEAPVVVLLHGLAGYGAEWQVTIDHLALEWRVLALDQRGHGDSTRTPENLSRDAYAGDVIALLDAVGVADPVVLIGQSMGAHTAMWTAARYRERIGRLVMIEGDVGGGGEEALNALRVWLETWTVPFSDVDAAVAFFGGDSPAARAWVAGLDVRPDGLWPRWEQQVMLRSMESVLFEESWFAWEALSQPTLLVVGENGIIDAGRVQRMVELRPETQLVTVPGAGHDVHLEQTSAWLRILDHWPVSAR